MTRFPNSRTSLGRVTLGRATLGLAAIGLAALGCTAIAAGTDTPDATPVACIVSVGSSGGLLTLAPSVQATDAVSGHYALRVEGPGTRMNQGGPFSVAAGQTLTLGQMRMSGTGSDLDIDLTLTIDGQTYRCPTDL